MDNNFSAQVKEIISFSREEALRLGNDFIGTEHLLLGLIREGENTAVKILKNLNVDLYELRKEVELAVKDKTGKNIANINSLPLTRQAEKVIRVTVLEAKALKSPTVETEHLMLSILKNKENIATQILNQFDIDYDLFRNELGVVKSNDVRSEYTDDPDDEFDEEKRGYQQKAKQQQGNNFHCCQKFELIFELLPNANTVLFSVGGFGRAGVQWCAMGCTSCARLCKVFML